MIGIIKRPDKLKATMAIVAFLMMTTFASAAPYKTLDIENPAADNSLQRNRLGFRHGVYYQRPSEVHFSVNEGRAKTTFKKVGGSIAGFFTDLAAGSRDITEYDEIVITGLFPSTSNVALQILTALAPSGVGTTTLPLKEYLVTANTYVVPLTSLPEVDLKKVQSLRMQPQVPGKDSFIVTRIILREFNEPVFPNPVAETYLIDHFNNAVDRFGNRDVIYYQAPSEISVQRLAKVPGNDTDRCLRITARNDSTGYALYAHPLLKDGELYSIRNYRGIMLKVRGEKGGEDMDIAFTDNTKNSFTHPWIARRLSDYLGHPLTTAWEGVFIPLADFGPIPGDKVKELLFIFPADRTNTIYVDDLRFSLKEVSEQSTELSKGKIQLFDFSNGLKSIYNAPIQPFKTPPASIELRLSSVGMTSGNAQCLGVQYKRMGDGICGFTASLKDKDTYLVADSFKFLAFRVRGDERAVFDVYVLDKSGSSAVSGQLPLMGKKVTVRNITGQWQWVTIPLADLGIDTGNLAAISFTFPERGSGTVYIDDISLLRE